MPLSLLFKAMDSTKRPTSPSGLLVPLAGLAHRLHGGFKIDHRDLAVLVHEEIARVGVAVGDVARDVVGEVTLAQLGQALAHRVIGFGRELALHRVQGDEGLIQAGLLFPRVHFFRWARPGASPPWPWPWTPPGPGSPPPSTRAAEPSSSLPISLKYP